MPRKTISNPERAEYDQLVEFLNEKEQQLKELYKNEYARKEQLFKILYSVN